MSAPSPGRDVHAVMSLEMTVNGQPVQLTIEPRELLVEVLRDRLGLYGTKRSCDLEICGACTVLVDGLAVSSCTFLAYEARRREVLTIEGLAGGEPKLGAQAARLHPIQQAFLEASALQCGFCTPGMVLTAKALLDELAAPTESEIREYLRGNICRCTGYNSIVKAVAEAATEQEQQR
jgi:carbon-monoxide dehydrogenase small subunit